VTILVFEMKHNEFEYALCDRKIFCWMFVGFYQIKF